MKHGRSRYAKEGCRCDECRTDHARASKEYRARHPERRDYERAYYVANRETRWGRTAEDRQCAQCGKTFNPWPTSEARQARDFGRFCSIACASTKDGAKYRRSIRNGHPLATANGRVTIYRAMLYDRIGPGAHACHWCSREVTWAVRRGRGVGRDDLVVDHLDGDPQNNAPQNLVVACGNCNTTRALMISWERRTGKSIKTLV